MSRSLLFFALFFAFGRISSAQITLTASTSTPIPGDTAIYYRDYDSGNPGAAGANVTWDFSYLTPGHRDTICYVDSLSGCISLPAQLHAYTASKPCLYYNFDSSSLQFRGETTSWSYVSYSNALLMLQFPMAFNGNVYVDTFGYTDYDGSSATTGAGYQILFADAYGTLILPDTTYANVLRVKKVVTVKTAYQIFGWPPMPPSTSVYELYEWYSDVASRTYLLQVSKNISTTEVQEFKTQCQDVRVFPNPANNKLHVRWTGYAEHVHLKDITGRTLKTISCQKDATDCFIAVNDMEAGIYILSIETATGSIVRKIQVQ